MIQAICWTLIHSLWQGLIFTVITGLVMQVTKKTSAAVRYNSLCMLLFLFLLVCGCTFLFEWDHLDGQSSGLAFVAPFSGKPIAWLVATLNDYLTGHAALIVLIWCLLFTARCVRLMAGVVYSQRIRSCKTFSPPVYWSNKMDSLRASLQIKKRVGLMESALTGIPIVIGHLRPVIFIPFGLLTSLPEGEIEAVLLHELAHIRRHDYLVNFLQNMAINIFFFNPGLLWISSLIKDERENCCDDIAIALTKDKFQFVRALVSFKQHALETSTSYGNVANIAPAFAGSRNKLLQRVMRIVHSKNTSLNPAERIFFLTSCCLAASLLFAASTARPVHKISAPTTVIIDKQQASGGDRQPSTDNAQPSADNAQPSADNDEASAALEQVSGDLAQIDIDKKKADEDQRQLDKDQVQSNKDQVQSNRDKMQSDKDRIQAEIDRQLAEFNEQQAEKSRRQAEKEKAEADYQRHQ